MKGVTLLFALVVTVFITRAAADASLTGGELTLCSMAPLTGWFRDGYCRTQTQDSGVHVVCAQVRASLGLQNATHATTPMHTIRIHIQVDAAFLSFTASRGNNLGLSPGDRWCLCALVSDPVRLLHEHPHTYFLTGPPTAVVGSVRRRRGAAGRCERH